MLDKPLYQYQNKLRIQKNAKKIFCEGRTIFLITKGRKKKMEEITRIIFNKKKRNMKRYLIFTIQIKSTLQKLLIVKSLSNQ